MKTNVLITTTVVWIAVAVTAYFAGKSSGKVEPRYVDKIVEVTKTNTVTVLVDKPVEVWKTNLVRVPVEVVKEVPAAIPEDYVTAKLFADKVRAAKFVTSYASLAGVERVALEIYLSDLEGVLTEADIRDNVELELRRSSIRIDPKAAHRLVIEIDALWDKDKNFATFTISTFVSEVVTYWRKAEIVTSYAHTWDHGSFGKITKAGGKQFLKDSVAGQVVKFSNEYLKANEK